MLINFALCANSQRKNLITSTVVARKHSPPLQPINALVKQAIAMHITCACKHFHFSFLIEIIYLITEQTTAVAQCVPLCPLKSFRADYPSQPCRCVCVCAYLNALMHLKSYRAVAMRLLLHSAVRHLLRAPCLQRLVCASCASVVVQGTAVVTARVASAHSRQKYDQFSCLLRTILSLKVKRADL